jgi:hypothetical protein
MSATGSNLRPSSTATTSEQRVAAAVAPVRDPLWFLARQLQTGAFFADDAGSPVTVTMSHVTAPLFIAGHQATGALEPDVEAEPAPAPERVPTADRVRFAVELLRRITDGGANQATREALRTGLAAAYPLVPAPKDPLLASVTSRLPDPITLHAAWVSAIGPTGDTGALPALPDGTTLASVEPAVRGWVGWVTGQVGPPAAAPAPPRWDAARLAYTVGLSAPLGPNSVILTAAEYDGLGLDWFTFDRSPLSSAPAAGPVTSVRPSPVTYPGMPERGYWTIEDGNVNLDVLAGQDPARQILAAFAHAYANDWFLIPMPIEPGATLITSLTVIDTFGAVTQVPAAAVLDGPAARFKLWELDVTATDVDAGVGMRVLLPPAAAPLESRPIEDVMLARDEMANLGWLIELTTQDRDGRRVDRYQRWLTMRGPSDPTFRPGEEIAQHYRLGTTLPDFWYPLEAVPATGSRPWQLGLASLPPGASDVSDAGVAGVAVTHADGTAVNDEEVSRTGTRVSRVDRLAYGPTGRRVWRARRREPGTGEASSGLRFDVIGPPAPPTHS